MACGGPWVGVEVSPRWKFSYHHLEDLDLADATPQTGLACPDLTTFCRLDELGLVVTGQRLRPDRAVLACRVVDPDHRCPGGAGRGRETRPDVEEARRRRAPLLDYPRTSNGSTEAINGRLEHLRGTALGFRNPTNYAARSLLETGGCRPQLLHTQLRRACKPAHAEEGHASLLSVCLGDHPLPRRS